MHARTATPVCSTRRSPTTGRWGGRNWEGQGSPVVYTWTVSASIPAAPSLFRGRAGLPLWPRRGMNSSVCLRCMWNVCPSVCGGETSYELEPRLCHRLRLSSNGKLRRPDLLRRRYPCNSTRTRGAMTFRLFLLPIVSKRQSRRRRVSLSDRGHRGERGRAGAAAASPASVIPFELGCPPYSLASERHAIAVAQRL